MINGLSVNSVGCQQNSVGPISLHFTTYNNNNNNSSSKNINKNNNSGLKTMSTMAATVEHNNNKNISNNNNIVAAATRNANQTGTETTKLLKLNENAGWPKAPLKQILYTPDDILKPTATTTAAAPTAATTSTAKTLATYANTSRNTKEHIINGKFQWNSSGNIQIKNENSSDLMVTTKNTTTTTTSTLTPKESQQKQRTEDQENAFRRIEDVHNYAKQQNYSYSNEGSTEDEDEDDDDEAEAEDDDNIFELQIIKNANNNNYEDSEEHVDVETVSQKELEEEEHKQTQKTTKTKAHKALASVSNNLNAAAMQSNSNAPTGHTDVDMRPEHHARRPMNAFLIFCKRHRAIVKDRYKSLENRAITKILGDWWAALDEQEKQCFTELAQQNKDAFFNANPNFKWYKLPAPPLRTLATRPSNASTSNPMALSAEQATQWESMPSEQDPLSTVVAQNRNYFKLADETQMGELSTLLSGRTVAVQDKDFALQQALSETTQFLSVHMPHDKKDVSGGKKRSLLPHDSGSNSSEEDVMGAGTSSKKLKSARSCKGKIYQELINSGQIAAVAKKSKSKSLNTQQQHMDQQPISPPEHQLLDMENRPLPASQSGYKHIRSTSECSSIGTVADFDLEEKIKELPALSLDAYLQRKRNIKKKKKFTTSKKQRNSNSSSVALNPIGTVVPEAQQAAAAAAAVGSQKRKARKESITRRDVSAIDQEVASIMPLTINGCYYFNETTPAMAGQRTQAAAGGTNAELHASPALSSGSSTMSAYEQKFDVTSTSDLLILAEVAANRTELNK